MLERLRPGLFASLLALGVVIAGCGGDDPDNDLTLPTLTATATSQSNPLTPTVTPADDAAPRPTASPFALDSDQPNGQRIYDIAKILSVDIGPRPSGTDVERQAAQYLADLLRGFGYEVELQEFSVGREVERDARLAITSPTPRTVVSVPLSNSSTDSATGPLVFGGLGTPDEIPPEADGAILLLERGDLLFQEKVDNAEAAGARGVVIFNNEPGTFFGTLDSTSAIPALSISLAEGEYLLDRLSNDPLTVDMEVGALSTASSYNVIATPPGETCQTISGGHYDSVQQAPGASDNATGTATVVEIAAVLATRGEMGANCFALWGSEEIGLFGSKAYVEGMTEEERAALRAVLNFDMVGVGEDTWLLAGSPELQNLAQADAEELGIGTTLGQLSSNTSSDHASFINAGIPAVMFHRLTDNLLHTPEDVINRVSPALLEEAARMGLALLETLNGGA